MEPHFTATSDAPYDQCVYLLVMEDGKVDSVWEDYEHVRDHWMVYHGRTSEQKMKTIYAMTRDEWAKQTGQSRDKKGFG